MIRASCIALAAFAICGIAATIASATPSTQIWIPSTDVQPYKTFHLNLDTYVRTTKEDPANLTGAVSNQNLPPVYVIGPTVGVSPFEKVQAEVGFDLIYGGVNTNLGLDKYPLYFHAKVGTPEGSLFKLSPAIAVGGYNFGTKSGDARKGELATNQNIFYGLVAKTIPVVGRLSAGYFAGNKKVLVKDTLDAGGNFESDEKGVLLSWDRTLAEISDKIWVGVDYQGSESAVGAFNFGVSYAFAKNVSVILGYDVYSNRKVAGENTVTLQVDINFP
ncbi:MAG: hypothetical protein C4529_13455 [Deltaproteobacteria bacterium]|nr:MAG: hypothetical protein C4529_13455 [Deltaproteobacteria bacterium]